MKAQKNLTIITFLGALFVGLSDHAAATGQGNSAVSYSRNQATAHTSNSASVNNNAQWSADPTRGWVRAEERHDLKKSSLPAKSTVDKPKKTPKTKAQRY